MTDIDQLADDAAHEGACGCGWQRVLEASLEQLTDALDYGKLNAEQRERYIEATSVLATLRAAKMGLEYVNAR